MKTIKYFVDYIYFKWLFLGKLKKQFKKSYLVLKLKPVVSIVKTKAGKWTVQDSYRIDCKVDNLQFQAMGETLGETIKTLAARIAEHF